jgi:shikimate kinase
MRNIVLIGLPGCGKTTIGKLLAKRLKRPFYDADVEVVRMSGETISEMFNKSEDYFRDREEEAIARLSEKENAIISCGGGVVKRPDNMKRLASKGVILFLDRDVEHIIASVDTASRPLLKEGREKVRQLDRQRHALYLQYSEKVFPVNEKFAVTADEIAAWIKSEAL